MISAGTLQQLKTIENVKKSFNTPSLNVDQFSCCKLNIERIYLMNSHNYILIILITPPPPEGVARYCSDPVCMYVCVSQYTIRPIFWYFIYRLLEETFIQDTDRVVLNSLKINWPSYVKGQGRRDATLLFEGTYHKNWGIEFFFHRHLLGSDTLFDETIQ